MRRIKLQTQRNGCLDHHSVRELLDYISVKTWEIFSDNDIDSSEADDLLKVIDNAIEELEEVNELIGCA